MGLNERDEMTEYLLLKAVHRSDKQKEYLKAAKEFYNTYFQNVGVITEKEYRMITLQTVGALILARTDGKSRVDYLSDIEKEKCRTLGKGLLEKSMNSLDITIQF